MDFEWDEDKATANERKHGEATSVFTDPLSLTGYDPDHSDEEDRFITMGLSANVRTVIVSHTDRGEKIRIISAREASRAERRDYEDGNFP